MSEANYLARGSIKKMLPEAMDRAFGWGFPAVSVAKLPAPTNRNYPLPYEPLPTHDVPPEAGSGNIIGVLPSNHQNPR